MNKMYQLHTLDLEKKIFLISPADKLRNFQEKIVNLNYVDYLLKIIIRLPYSVENYGNIVDFKKYQHDVFNGYKLKYLAEKN